MSPQHPAIRWISDDEIRRIAENFLASEDPSRTIPVPVEQIVEQRGIDIVPIHQMQDKYDLVGCTSKDLQSIYVDQFIGDRRENRYRFTLAHEIGHVVMHADLIAELTSESNDLTDWFRAYLELSEGDYRGVEWQADAFAGLVLVPSAELAARLALVRAEVDPLVADATRRGIDGGMVQDYARESAAERIAPSFAVSAEVVSRRLKFEGVTF